MRALLALVLLLPAATATAAYPDGAEMGALDARVPVRVQGTLHVAADAEVKAALAAPGETPGNWTSTPADLAARPGAWRGLEGISMLWLRRSSTSDVTVEASDATREGVVLVWPGLAKVPGIGLLPWLGAVALLGSRRQGALRA